MIGQYSFFTYKYHILNIAIMDQDHFRPLTAIVSLPGRLQVTIN
jgi:hypothetical protein